MPITIDFNGGFSLGSKLRQAGVAWGLKRSPPVPRQMILPDLVIEDLFKHIHLLETPTVNFEDIFLGHKL
jgi:hypothetical protein